MHDPHVSALGQHDPLVKLNRLSAYLYYIGQYLLFRSVLRQFFYLLQQFMIQNVQEQIFMSCSHCYCRINASLQKHYACEL